MKCGSFKHFLTQKVQAGAFIHVVKDEWCGWFQYCCSNANGSKILGNPFVDIVVLAGIWVVLISCSSPAPATDKNGGIESANHI